MRSTPFNALMRVEVLFLGPAKEWAKTERFQAELQEGATVSELKRVIAARFPSMEKGFGVTRVAVNEQFAGDDEVLKDADTIALIPPVSGGCENGSIRIEISNRVIDFAAVRAFVAGDPAQGGIVIFEGTTRAEKDEQHGQLIRLDYEAYDSMARKQLQRLAELAKLRWSAGKIAIAHRVGAVQPGETSVAIAVACAHRREAFEACRWLIDTLKVEVPIWKKDVFEDGFVRWVQPQWPGQEWETRAEKHRS